MEDSSREPALSRSSGTWDEEEQGVRRGAEQEETREGVKEMRMNREKKTLNGTTGERRRMESVNECTSERESAGKSERIYGRGRRESR